MVGIIGISVLMSLLAAPGSSQNGTVASEHGGPCQRLSWVLGTLPRMGESHTTLKKPRFFMFLESVWACFLVDFCELVSQGIGECPVCLNLNVGFIVLEWQGWK